jgi:hypothetical protein
MAQEDGGGRELERVRRRLEQWRQQYGGAGRRIPEGLWAQAASVARVEGVAATARRLRLDRLRLERRVAGAPASLPEVWRSTGASNDFVEIDPVRSSLPSRTVVRVESPDGRRLHVESSARRCYKPASVVALGDVGAGGQRRRGEISAREVVAGRVGGHEGLLRPNPTTAAT